MHPRLLRSLRRDHPGRLSTRLAREAPGRKRASGPGEHERRDQHHPHKPRQGGEQRHEEVQQRQERHEKPDQRQPPGQHAPLERHERGSGRQDRGSDLAEVVQPRREHQRRKGELGVGREALEPGEAGRVEDLDRVPRTRAL